MVYSAAKNSLAVPEINRVRNIFIKKLKEEI